MAPPPLNLPMKEIDIQVGSHLLTSQDRKEWLLSQSRLLNHMQEPCHKAPIAQRTTNYDGDCTHRCLTETVEVHTEVCSDAVHGPREGDSPQKKGREDHIGHGSCDPHHLEEKTVSLRNMSHLQWDFIGDLRYEGREGDICYCWRVSCVGTCTIIGSFG